MPSDTEVKPWDEYRTQVEKPSPLPTGRPRGTRNIIIADRLGWVLGYKVKDWFVLGKATSAATAQTRTTQLRQRYENFEFISRGIKIWAKHKPVS